MKQVPFWVDDHPRPEGLTSDLPANCDYLIVGSGYTGLSAALRLTGSGKEVVLVDAGEIGGGASSMNGGFVSPDVKGGVDRVFAVYGPKLGHEMWASTVRATELVRDIARRPGVDAITHEAGIAALGKGSKQLKRFDKDVEWYREKFGVAWEVLDARDIHRIVGGDAFNIALLEPEGFGIHPARLVFGMAREAHREGAKLVDRCAAMSWENSGSGFSVQTTKGAISAGDVILATNGYTTRAPNRELKRLVVPVGSYIIATEPLGEGGADAVFPTGVVAWRHRRLLNYTRRTHDDRILMGGRRSLHTGLDLEASAADLRNTLTEFWPWLETVEITHVWGGKLGVTFDLNPHIGRVDGAWYALGYAGHGVALACQLGYELAGMLLGEDPLSVYSLIEHKSRFYYSGRNEWFLTPASYLYRALDRLGV